MDFQYETPAGAHDLGLVVLTAVCIVVAVGGIVPLGFAVLRALREGRYVGVIFGALVWLAVVTAGVLCARAAAPDEPAPIPLLGNFSDGFTGLIYAAAAVVGVLAAIALARRSSNR